MTAGKPGTSLNGRLAGSVIYRERIALDPNAVIEVQLLNVSMADAPAEVIASQTIQAGGRQVPLPFELSYDPAMIDDRMRYVVQARILVDGGLRWTSQESYPVLTQGSPVNEVEVLVRKTSSSPPAGAGGLEDREWRLVSMVVDGAGVGLEEGVATTIRFAADGRYSGSGGCNRYTGAYTRQGNSLSLGMAAATLMACQTGEEQERRFFAVLPQIATFQVTPEGLRLLSAGGKTALAFTASSAVS